MKRFKGVIPALVSPLDENERINVPVLRRLIEDLLAKGVDGFYLCGATGEGLALSVEERMRLAEEAIDAVGHRCPCIVQVAATDFQNAVALAKHAERVGADAISATAPLFFQYDKDDVYAYYKSLAAAVGIPLMAYYSPAAGFAFDAEFAARLFTIDNVTAIKWTSSDYYRMMRLRELTQGEMNILNGPDEMLLMGLSAGADGGIGTTYNFMPDIILSIYRSFIEGRLSEARKWQDDACHIIAALHKYKTIPATKVILEAMGYAVGEATFPMTRYTEAEKRQIISDFCRAGLNISGDNAPKSMKGEDL